MTHFNFYHPVEVRYGDLDPQGHVNNAKFLTYFEQTEWMNEGDQDFNTLAGFILHKLEHIPHTGETLDWKGFKFEIIDMDAQRIDKVLVQISKDIKEEMEEE